MANRFSFRKQLKTKYFDAVLLLTVAFLIIFGLVMLYSVSSYDASVHYDDASYFFTKQLKSTIVGILGMIVISVLPYHLYERFQIFIFLFALAMLALVVPYGSTVNGAKRWIYIGDLSIQPAEIAKVATIIVTAYLVMKHQYDIDTWKGILSIMSPSIIYAGMILFITKNLSSAIIVCGISFCMCFVAGKGYKKYLLMIFIIIAIAALAVFIFVKNADNPAIGYRGERVLAWLDPDAHATDKGFQTLQALYAIGSGGIMGKGIGESMQKMGYIPEAQNDMIFSIICEELGFIGALCVILLFMLLLWRCLIVANNANDMYGTLLVVGFMAQIAIQVILNIAVVTNTIPNTGISLPFISYGGSSVAILLAEVGMVLSVQRSIYVREM